ncbi:metallophosphoesterase family protein [Algihabitans albus]|uniref:metallophosphoesterase family protein n=1 Tax=Algihabitans albus TaxID=2164067 RepID=UPI000E5C7818|nr:metallophosphoesterase [Algihabitans albus]
MFRLAHLSDPHIAPLPPVRWRQLANKRLLGYLSWRRRRQHIHRREVLDALTRDLRAAAPDHTVVTGDLTNIALPAEFEQAATWLRALGPPDSVSVVPGNHDASVAVPWADSLGHIAAYMTSHDGADMAADETAEQATGFPFLRRIGEVALIGLSTALPTPPAFATGKLGTRQIEALEDSLIQLGREGLFRCVLLHHPPIAGAVKSRKRLIDAAAFRQAIARTGAELVLHGHDHRHSRGRIPGPAGPVPVCGVPSASALASHGRPAALYQLYAIGREGNAWRVDVSARTYFEEEGALKPAETRETILVPKPE